MSHNDATTRFGRAAGVLAALSILLGACGASDKSDGTPGGPTGPAAGYSLSISPASLSIAPAGTATAMVTVARTGSFTGGVTLSVEGAPTGMVVTVPAVGAGSSADAVVTVAPGAQVATGSHMLTVRGSASGLADRTASLAIAVTAASVTLDFSACYAGIRPDWVAFQDGAGAWVPLTASNDVYTATLGSSTGAVALLNGPPPVMMEVYFLTRGEFMAGLLGCGSTPNGTKTIVGNVAGVTLPDEAWISLGETSTSAWSNGPVTLSGVKDGPQDLVGYRANVFDPLNPGLPPHRLIIRRDQNIPNLGSFGTLDFNGAEASIPASARVTVSGLLASDSLSHDMGFEVGSPCAYAEGYSSPLVPGTSASFTAFGIPAALERSSDLHELAVFTNGQNTSRFVLELFHEMKDRTVTLPAQVPAPLITILAGSYPRPQASVAFPAAYQFLEFYYSTSGGASVDLFASAGWIGGGPTTLTTPDLSGVAGFTNAWMNAGTGSPHWELVVTNMNRSPGHTCFEGSFTTQSVIHTPWMQARNSRRRASPYGPLVPRALGDPSSHSPGRSAIPPSARSSRSP